MTGSSTTFCATSGYSTKVAAPPFSPGLLCCASCSVCSLCISRQWLSLGGWQTRLQISTYPFDLSSLQNCLSCVTSITLCELRFILIFFFCCCFCFFLYIYIIWCNYLTWFTMREITAANRKWQGRICCYRCCQERRYRRWWHSFLLHDWKSYNHHEETAIFFLHWIQIIAHMTMTTAVAPNLKKTTFFVINVLIIIIIMQPDFLLVYFIYIYKEWAKLSLANIWGLDDPIFNLGRLEWFFS